jgi:hypothetical protein
MDAIWWDQFAAYTSRLSDQETAWGLPQTTAPEAERRTRLAARKADTGGQSLAYLQGQLRARGFDVWVHDAYAVAPATPPVAPVWRDPRLYLAASNFRIVYNAECGEALAECGEPGAGCSDSAAPIGYPLVNVIERAVPNYLVLCSETLAECGEPTAQAGEFDKMLWIPENYNLPDDPKFWPFFGYVGGEIFGTQATVPAARRREFEQELFRMFPARLWIGVLVSYN